MTQTVEYTYDAQGRRVKRTLDANGAVTGGVSSESFVYDGDQLALRFGNAGELTHRYQYGPAVDQVLMDEVFSTAGQSVESLWPLADQQGTIRDLADDQEVLRKHVDYTSFGRITDEQFYSQAGAAISATHAEAIEQLFAYTGQERDGATGLYNIGVRWYDPWTGRWRSEDPIGLAGGDANFYRYVHNNPVIYVDPSGLRQQGNPLDSLFGNHNARVPVPTSLLSQPSLFGNHATSIPSLQTSVPSSSLQQASFGQASLSNSSSARSTAYTSVQSAANYFTSRPGYYESMASVATTPSWQQIQQSDSDRSSREIFRMYAAAEFGGRINEPVANFIQNIRDPFQSAYLRQTADQVVRGEFSNQAPTAASVGINIAAGFTGLDLPADIRDLSHNIANWQWSWGHAGQTSLNVASLFPVIGVFKHADEAVEVLQGTVKNVPSKVLVEQPRDALGRFLPKSGGEVRPGSLAEQATFDAVRQKPGWQVIDRPVSVRDATGQLRVYDGGAVSPSGRVIGLETKSGTGRLTPDQRAFDTRLNSSKSNTAPGVGQSSRFEIQRAIEVRR